MSAQVRDLLFFAQSVITLQSSFLQDVVVATKLDNFKRGLHKFRENCKPEDS